MFDGILLVDKPARWTSHDVVAKVRNIIIKQAEQYSFESSDLDAAPGISEERAKRRGATLSERQSVNDTAMRQKPARVTSSAGQHGKAVRRIKVGHTGTLDPMATGLLILVLGSYTKLAGEFSKLDKTYEAELTLGATSTTGDAEGEITKLGDRGEGIGASLEPREERVKEVLNSFVGEIEQVPHAYSAVKVDGQRAYNLARSGKKPEIEPRKVTIYEITDVEYDYPMLRFTTKVSSGTYIRSLAEDIGQKLDTGAYLSALRRTTVGSFKINNSLNIHNLSLLSIEKGLQK